MGTYFVGTQVLNQANNARTIINGETVYVLRTGALLSTFNYGILGNGVSLTQITVEGTVAGNQGGISLSAASAGPCDNMVNILQLGSVQGGDGKAIDMTGEGCTVINNGSVSSGLDSAVQILGYAARLNNSGTIALTLGGSSSSTVKIIGDAAALTNSGSIYNATEYAGVAAIEMVNAVGEFARVVNSGSITCAAIAILGGLGNDFVQNTGRIDGAIDLGGGVGHDRVMNSGDIFGTISGFGTNTSLIGNSGWIDGAVNCSTGADTVRNSGSIIQVQLGDGADVFRMSGDGIVTQGVYGGIGNDLEIGASQADDLFGDDGLDTLRGGGGDDSLTGGNQNDMLAGGGGDDVLWGGTGLDRMRGGDGADTFVFKTAPETQTGAGTDVIVDFQRGSDVIDVSALSGQVLQFTGTGALPGGGARAVNYVLDGNGNVIIGIDADGNGVAEGHILMLNLTALSASDFIL